MQKNTPLEMMYMEYANTVKHFLEKSDRMSPLSEAVK